MPNGVKISVEGGCGAGKTTLLNFLRSKWEKDQINFRDEPIGKECRQENLKKKTLLYLDEWRNVGGENLLDLYHKDRSRWSFSFQTKAITSNAKATVFTTTHLDKRGYCAFSRAEEANIL